MNVPSGFIWRMEGMYSSQRSRLPSFMRVRPSGSRQRRPSFIRGSGSEESGIRPMNGLPSGSL